MTGHAICGSIDLQVAPRPARLLVVKEGPHCIPWTHAEEVNAESLSFLGGKAGKSQIEAA
jgi:hypothetical protein